MQESPKSLVYTDEQKVLIHGIITEIQILLTQGMGPNFKSPPKNFWAFQNFKRDFQWNLWAFRWISGNG